MLTVTKQAMFIGRLLRTLASVGVQW